MSHHEIDRLTFANAYWWRKIRARIAANVRHHHDDRVQADRNILPLLREFASLHAITLYAPGAFELGTERAEFFYRKVDEWGSILAPHAFQWSSS